VRFSYVCIRAWIIVMHSFWAMHKYCSHHPIIWSSLLVHYCYSHVWLELFTWCAFHSLLCNHFYYPHQLYAILFVIEVVIHIRNVLVNLKPDWPQKKRKKWLCTFSHRRVSKGGKMSSTGSWVSNVGVWYERLKLG